MPTEAADVLASAAQAPRAARAPSPARRSWRPSRRPSSPGRRRRDSVVDLARSFLPAEAEPTVADLLLEGFVARFTAGYEHSVAPLRAAIRALAPTSSIPPLPQVVQPGMRRRRQPLGRPGAPRPVDPMGAAGPHARSAHDPCPSPWPSGLRHDVIAGRLDDADARAAEARELLAATGNVAFVGATGWNDRCPSRLRGRVDEARAAALALIEQATAGGQRLHWRDSASTSWPGSR